MTLLLSRRTASAAAAALLAGGLALTTAVPANAVTSFSVAPSRSFVSDSASLMSVADNGTIFNGYGPIDMLAPDSNGTPDVLKEFTGMSVSGGTSYLPSTGLAWADNGSPSVFVMDPSQSAGAYVATRTLTGANTEIEDPAGVAWASDGSLWVLDTEVSGSSAIELLRFAPGANGNVAPVQEISGSKTGLIQGSSSLLGVATIAALPSHGIVVSMGGVRPGFSVFTGSQSGNVAPARTVELTTAAPSFLQAGVATDAQGRIYIGAGDVNNGHFGILDVYTSTGTKLVELGGAKQNLRLPLAPAVSPNGTIALIDGTIISIGGGSTYQDIRIEVYKPLFTKPGAVKSLAVKKVGTTQRVSWKAPTNPSGSPLSYTVVVKKGTKKLFSKSLAGTSVAIPRKSLAAGSLKVTVTAKNIGGTGPATSKSFKN